LGKLIFSEKDVKNAVDSAFKVEDRTARVFKVLISRKDRFVRITIYLVTGKDQLIDYPSSYFTYNLNTFLCYNGSELITGRTLDADFMNKLTRGLPANSAGAGSVVQFDMAVNKVIIMHNPPIDPYGIDEPALKFQPPNKPIH
jgi:hypothetical protein